MSGRNRAARWLGRRLGVQGVARLTRELGGAGAGCRAVTPARLAQRAAAATAAHRRAGSFALLIALLDECPRLELPLAAWGCTRGELAVAADSIGIGLPVRLPETDVTRLQGEVARALAAPGWRGQLLPLRAGATGENLAYGLPAAALEERCRYRVWPEGAGALRVRWRVYRDGVLARVQSCTVRLAEDAVWQTWVDHTPRGPRLVVAGPEPTRVVPGDRGDASLRACALGGEEWQVLERWVWRVDPEPWRVALGREHWRCLRELRLGFAEGGLRRVEEVFVAEQGRAVMVRRYRGPASAAADPERWRALAGGPRVERLAEDARLEQVLLASWAIAGRLGGAADAPHPPAGIGRVSAKRSGRGD